MLDGNKMKLTEAAKDKITNLIETDPKDGMFLRFAVQPGGCSGLRYQFYFDNEPNFEDQVIRHQAFDLRIDKMSWPYLSEATMDYVESIDKIGFIIDNPAAQGSCACGDSFN